MRNVCSKQLSIFIVVAAATHSAPTAHSFSLARGSASAFVAPLQQQQQQQQPHSVSASSSSSSSLRMSAVVGPGFGSFNGPSLGPSGSGYDMSSSYSAYTTAPPDIQVRPADELDAFEEVSAATKEEPAMYLAHPSLSKDLPLAPVAKSHGLLDPELIGVIRDRVGADDPVLAAFFSDFMNEGPLASMHHLGNPGVASRLSALMGEVVTRRPSNPQGGVPTAGWCRRSRFSSPLRAHPDESQQL
jgi:hypothetical protein